MRSRHRQTTYLDPRQGNMYPMLCPRPLDVSRVVQVRLGNSERAMAQSEMDHKRQHEFDVKL
ncbi:hypothetical protein PILCRDRAFT_813717 [Piloderma croceum F 1598]|uniref:Uncharacterized protein n=1 Tax=Piloderma croceum (strain F 1598) TaxID=765440 RepID=A0A0C3CG63_PILCF|nr:hypothetical protein PILCRDRAFT_813717 [Piloderma croceum F 1598]